MQNRRNVNGEVRPGFVYRNIVRKYGCGIGINRLGHGVHQLLAGKLKRKKASGPEKSSARGHLLLMVNLVREDFRGGDRMPLDDEVIEALGGLIKELRKALGDKALTLPSVRKAMLVLSRNAWEDAQRFVNEVEAREIQDD